MLIPVSIMKAQAYTMTNGQTINVCSSKLLDLGGSANYTNNTNVNFTLCSSSVGSVSNLVSEHLPLKRVGIFLIFMATFQRLKH